MVRHFREVALGEGEHLLGLSPPQLYTAAGVLAVTHQQCGAGAYGGEFALFSGQQPPMFFGGHRTLISLAQLFCAGLPGSLGFLFSISTPALGRQCAALFGRHLGCGRAVQSPLLAVLRELGFTNLPGFRWVSSRGR